MLRAIQKIGDNHTKAHTVSELNPEASDEQRIHDSEAQAVPSTEVSYAFHGCANESSPYSHSRICHGRSMILEYAPIVWRCR